MNHHQAHATEVPHVGSALNRPVRPRLVAVRPEGLAASAVDDGLTTSWSLDGPRATVPGGVRVPPFWGGLVNAVWMSAVLYGVLAVAVLALVSLLD